MSQVINTIKFENYVRRYRQCGHCQKRWPTTEISHKPKATKDEAPGDEMPPELFVIDDDFE